MGQQHFAHAHNVALISTLKPWAGDRQPGFISEPSTFNFMKLDFNSSIPADAIKAPVIIAYGDYDCAARCHVYRFTAYADEASAVAALAAWSKTVYCWLLYRGFDY